MTNEDDLSTAATALMLLVWQEPSDRALAGWTPYPGLHPDNMSAEGLTRWLRDQVRSTLAETDDSARLRTQ